MRELVGFSRLGLTHSWWETMEPAPSGMADRAHQYLGGFDAYDIDLSWITTPIAYTSVQGAPVSLLRFHGSVYTSFKHLRSV